MKKLIVAISFLISLGGCSAEAEYAERSFFAMDTYMSMRVIGSGADAAAEKAEKTIRDLEKLFSKTRSGSDIARINSAGASRIPVSAETAELINLSIEYYYLTGGVFDITVGPLVNAWGTDRPDDFKVPDDFELSTLMGFVGSDMISVISDTVELGKENMALDLGGSGKGYAGKKAGEAVRECGVSSAILSLGGNIVCIGSAPGGAPWRVAVQSPDGSEAYIGVLDLSDTCAVTSGAYRRYSDKDGVRYHHIIDPHTGRPADSGIVSATVVCEDSAIADILSTAVFVMGADKANELRKNIGGFETVLLTEDGFALVSRGLADRFSLSADSGYILKIHE
ncbi:MAG: FAD:protein FMN transferase [Oscillospiraceae bacterium]|nr:FAD:protein FMN transferase [Oscillospiraceae bacterium]